MISPVTICFCIFTLFVSLILPPVFAIVYSLRHRHQGVPSAWLLGAAGFEIGRASCRERV